MTTRTYAAPWGRRIWLITGAVTLFGLVFALVLPWSLPVRNPDERRVLWLVAPVALLIVAGSSFWMIRGFELTSDTLIVHRSFWSNRIPLAAIQSAGLDARACEGAMKTLGNDGLFAMHGRFRSKRLGKFQAYVTDPANSVVLKLASDTIVISPANPRQFLSELNRRLAHFKEPR